MIAPKTVGESVSPPDIGLFRLSLIAIFVGAVTGFGAIGFRGLIGFIHNLFFLGRISFFYDANTHTPASPWGVFIVLVPVVGALIVTLLVTKFAPEARGHGVPEVMDAVYYSEGRIRPMVAAIKSLASALSIGSGAAVGREGPIIQIGASLGSTIGQIIPLAAWQRITLVAAGAGSGIAATFNTPLGGVMFAIELMMPEVSVRTFLPVALATGTATFIARLFVGLDPAFQTPPILAWDHHPTSFDALLLYAIVGILTGLAATAFIQGLHRTEALFDRIGNPYLRHVIGMLIVGVMIYTLFQTFGHYYVEGVGYATVQDVLIGGVECGAPARTVVRLQARGHTLKSRFRCFRGHFFAVTFYGRDSRRRTLRRGQSDSPITGAEYPCVCHRRDGGHGGRRNGRGDDRGDYDLRDDS
jgi:CIC family chloride channel protein